MKVLVTCPPMLGRMEHYKYLFEDKKVELLTPEIVQTLSENELLQIVPEVDGWIIGDDPATSAVFEAGVRGKLKAAVKWGVGVDNVDFKAAKRLNLPISNTPGMFGEEVSDVAIGMMINLARDLHTINEKVRKGQWYKPAGMSLFGKKAGVVGYGDIGRAVVRKLKAFNIHCTVYDPYTRETVENLAVFPDQLEQQDIIIITCALTSETKHLFNTKTFESVGKGAMIINVSRGPLIDEKALVTALESGRVSCAGMEVLENEPLQSNSPLLKFDNILFGSHNASNTKEAVDKTSNKAIKLLFDFLGL